MLPSDHGAWCPYHLVEKEDFARKDISEIPGVNGDDL